MGKLADFQAEIDLESFFPSGIDDEQLALDMVKAGQEVMQRAITQLGNIKKPAAWQAR